MIPAVILMTASELLTIIPASATRWPIRMFFQCKRCAAARAGGNCVDKSSCRANCFQFLNIHAATGRAPAALVLASRRIGMKVALAYKNLKAANPVLSHIGLGVTAHHGELCLRESAIPAEAWAVMEGHHLWRMLARRPDVTHVIT